MRAADHGENLSGGRTNGHERGLVGADAFGLALRDAPIHGGLRDLLHVRIERCVHFQAALVGGLFAEIML